MKFALIHLSGPHQGKTQYFDKPLVSLGSAPDNDLVFPAEGPQEGIPHRVELVQTDCEVQFRNHDSNHTTLINHNPLVEAVLQDKDLMQLGPEGPKLRFRIRAEAYAACKGGPELLRDALDVATEARRAGRGRVRPFVGQLAHELRRNASHTTQMLFAALLVLVIGGLGGLGYYSYSFQQNYTRQLFVLSKELESARITQKDLERRTIEERQRLQDVLHQRQTELDQLAAQVEAQQQASSQASVEEVRILEARLKTLETEAANAEVLIKRYGPSIGFLYVAFGLFDEGGIPQNFSKIPLEYMGTGFLIDGKGHLVTNRHIVEPWHINPSVGPLVEAGLAPKLLTLLAYFPNQPQPYKVSVLRVSDQGDVALGQLSPVPQGIPPIPIHPLAQPSAIGEPVMVLGYPVGVEALLARMDEFTVDTLLRDSGHDLKILIQGVANLKGIRPLATQGHIGDVVPKRIVYDAPTTGGASGSPVFNSRGEVIAVNASVMTRFGGANSGVPIDLALALLSPES